MMSRMCRLNLREFLRSFDPLCFVLKISGLSPNEIREANDNLITRRSTLGTIHTIIVIILYSGVFYFMKKNDIVMWKLNGVLMVIENIQLFAFELIFYIMILSAIIRQKGFSRIIKSFSELDSLLCQLGEEIDYRKEFIRNMIIVGSLFISTGGSGMVGFIKMYRPGFEYIFHSLLWFSPLFIMRLMLLHFSIMVFSLKLRCSKLNNAMSKIINFTNKQNWNVVPSIEIEYQNSQVKYCSYNIADTIWNMSIIYDMICDVCKIITKVFSFQTTIGLGAESAFLTFNIYQFATYVKETTHAYEWEALAISSQTLLIHIITIFGVIYCCDGAQSEANQVAIFLHKVKPRRVEHREAINTFSLQSMHQKVQFTACGLFNLDYTFIYLLISTISTYMVIIVQFGQADSP